MEKNNKTSHTSDWQLTSLNSTKRKLEEEQETYVTHFRVERSEGRYQRSNDRERDGDRQIFRPDQLVRTRELRQEYWWHEKRQSEPLQGADRPTEHHTIHDRREYHAQLEQYIPEWRGRIVHRRKVYITVNRVEKRWEDVETR